MGTKDAQIEYYIGTPLFKVQSCTEEAIKETQHFAQSTSFEFKYCAIFENNLFKIGYLAFKLGSTLFLGIICQ
jgi:hypothetical protein